MDLALVKRGIIGWFTGLYPSSRSMGMLMQKNKVSIINGKLSRYLCGRGFYAFCLKRKRKGASSSGVVLTLWVQGILTSIIKLQILTLLLDIPSVVPIWV
jgi:hypothetical protein